MNRHQALSALAAADPLAGTTIPTRDVDTAVADLLEASPQHVTDLSDVPGTAAGRRLDARRVRSALVASLVVAAVLVAGGLVVRQVRNHTSSPADNGRFAADADGRLLMPAELVGVQLQPPTGDQHPTLSADEADRICFLPGNGCPRDAGPLTTVLANATTDNNARIRPDGTLQRTIDNRLVWAVMWPSVCMPSGPGLDVPGSTPLPPMPVACTYLALFDAGTGAPLFLGSGG